MKITVYTITDCPFCKQEKDFLNAQGLQFEEKNVQENREFLTEMLEKSDKFAGVPFTIIEKDGGEKVNLKGFTQSEFEQALGLSAGGATAMTAATTAPAPVAAPTDMPTDMSASAPASPAAPAMPSSPVASSMPDAVSDMPSMPGIDEAPQSPSMTSSTQTPEVPTTPAMPVAPEMPAAPAMPTLEPTMSANPTSTMPSAPTEVAPANPQSQLDGLLADLQTKSQPDLPDFNAPASSDTAPQQQ